MCDVLKNFLIQNCLSREWLAENIDVDEGSLSRYIKGKRIPSKKIMQKIYEVTGGHVRPDHFYDLPDITQVLPFSGIDGESEVMQPEICLGSHCDGYASPLSQNLLSRSTCSVQAYRLPQDEPLFPEVFQT